MFPSRAQRKGINRGGTWLVGRRGRPAQRVNHNSDDALTPQAVRTRRPQPAGRRREAENGAGHEAAGSAAEAQPGLQTGLDEEAVRAGKGKVRRAAPPLLTFLYLRVRSGPQSRITITGNEMSCTPKVCCNNCGKRFSGGLTHIKKHILGIGLLPCATSSEEFVALKGARSRNR